MPYVDKRKPPLYDELPCKLTATNSMQVLMNTVAAYLTDKIDDSDLWKLKHKERFR